MSGSVLASIIQNCKARNKCFTSSPQDATPVQGLHSSRHRAHTGAKRGGGGGRKQGGQERRRSSAGESERVSCISKHIREILKMLAPIHPGEFLSSRRCLWGCRRCIKCHPAVVKRLKSRVGGKKHGNGKDCLSKNVFYVLLRNVMQRLRNRSSIS